MQSSMAESGQFYDAQAAIKKHDQEAYDILLKNAETNDGYLKKAEEEVKSGRNKKKGNIGGFIPDPEQSGKNPEAEAKATVCHRAAGWRRILPPLQNENRKEEIDRMQAGTEKKLAQIEYDYNAGKKEIKPGKPTGSVRTRKPVFPRR